ncbi:hypothetical protein QTI24_24475 [Variovorax sp. J22P240]|uniref:hypothetical protein n=1 Tax=Variovorax sp. J22P240 TaxID=3053514 RepID=UPI00257741DF|nr:hypothetical protein [Variovorax sp. J22P240]MDM0001786.1 hypothetical protein [Variovorax sp. J22P240]
MGRNITGVIGRITRRTAPPLHPRWLLVSTVVACVGVVWIFMIGPMQHRGWKSPNGRMAAQVTQSAELLSE